MPDSTPTITRRGMLAAGGAAILGAAGGYALGVRQGDPLGRHPDGRIPDAQRIRPRAAPAQTTFAFYGEHQPGIETPPALLQTFIGLDLVDPTPSNADAVLRLVSDDAARLMAGEPALGDTEAELAAHPAGLTVSVGLGRPLFTRTGRADAHPRPAHGDPGLQHRPAGGRLVADRPAPAGRQRRCRDPRPHRAHADQGPLDARPRALDAAGLPRRPRPPSRVAPPRATSWARSTGPINPGAGHARVRRGRVDRRRPRVAARRDGARAAPHPHAPRHVGGPRPAGPGVGDRAGHQHGCAARRDVGVRPGPVRRGGCERAARHPPGRAHPRRARGDDRAR